MLSMVPKFSNTLRRGTRRGGNSPLHVLVTRFSEANPLQTPLRCRFGHAWWFAPEAMVCDRCRRATRERPPTWLNDDDDSALILKSPWQWGPRLLLKFLFVRMMCAVNGHVVDLEVSRCERCSRTFPIQETLDE